MNVYLAGPWERRPQLARLARYLENHGHRVTSRWLTEHGESSTVEESRVQAQHDLDDIDAADALVLDTRVDGSPRGGRHTELGYALAKCKAIHLIGPRVNVFHALAAVTSSATAPELLEALRT